VDIGKFKGVGVSRKEEIEGEPTRDIDRLAMALRDLGLRQSLLEMALINMRGHESSDSRPVPSITHGDPPCVVCGVWTDDWLCERCRERWWWAHPLRGS
jgi:hypothetical protein